MSNSLPREGWTANTTKPGWLARLSYRGTGSATMCMSGGTSMRSYLNVLLTVAVFLAPAGLWGQSQEQNPALQQRSDLLARFSYRGSSVVLPGEGFGQLCISVSREGDYRISRLLPDGESQRLRGKISEEQFQQLKKMLASSEFRGLSGSHGGLIRQEAESFGAEIPRKNGVQWLQWLNADGQNPFPDSVAKVINWLERFEPKNGEAFEYAEFPDVCPSRGLSLLQPSVAVNEAP
jgi:hypothetical protein